MTVFPERPGACERCGASCKPGRRHATERPADMLTMGERIKELGLPALSESVLISAALLLANRYRRESGEYPIRFQAKPDPSLRSDGWANLYPRSAVAMIDVCIQQAIKKARDKKKHPFLSRDA